MDLCSSVLMIAKTKKLKKVLMRRRKARMKMKDTMTTSDGCYRG